MCQKFWFASLCFCLSFWIRRNLKSCQTKKWGLIGNTASHNQYEQKKSNSLSNYNDYKRCKLYVCEFILHHIIILIQLMQLCCRVMYLTLAFEIRLYCTHEKPEMCRDKSVLSETIELAQHFFFCSSASSVLSLYAQRVLTVTDSSKPFHLSTSIISLSLYQMTAHCITVLWLLVWQMRLKYNLQYFLCLINADRVYELQLARDNRITCERVLLGACTK